MPSQETAHSLEDNDGALPATVRPATARAQQLLEEKKLGLRRGRSFLRSRRCIVFALFHCVAVCWWFGFHVAEQAPRLHIIDEKAKWRRAKVAQEAMARRVNWRAVNEAQSVWSTELDPQSTRNSSSPPLPLPTSTPNLLRELSQPSAAAIHYAWAPNGEPRQGPLSIRSLGNSKYLSVSSRGQVRPAAHDALHKRAHWFLVPVMDRAGNRAMALQSALSSSFVAALEFPGEPTAGVDEEGETMEGEVMADRPGIAEPAASKADDSGQLVLNTSYPIGWDLYGQDVWSGQQHKASDAPGQTQKAMRLVARSPCGSSDSGQRSSSGDGQRSRSGGDEGGHASYHASTACLRYILPQPPPGLGVELRAGKNCSRVGLQAVSFASDLPFFRLEFGWELQWVMYSLSAAGGAEGGSANESATGGAAEVDTANATANSESGATLYAHRAQPTDKESPTIIALGVAVRTHSALLPDALPLIKVFIPSLLKTISTDFLSGEDQLPGALSVDRNGFHYRLMLGYDAGDPTYDDPVLLSAVGAQLRRTLGNAPVSVHAVRYDGFDRGAPCWVWNKLFARSCDEGAHYFYQEMRIF